MGNRIEDLLPFYALGSLSAEEREQVEAYLAEHPEVREQLRGMEDAAFALPFGASPLTPSERPKQQLMARVAEDRRSRASQEKSSMPARAERPGIGARIFEPRALSLFSLLAAGAAIILLFVLTGQISRLRDEVSALRTAMVVQTNNVEQLKQALDEVNIKIQQPTPPAVMTTFAIDGTAAQPQAHGQLFTDPRSNSAVLVVADLAQVPAGKTYQIWLIQGDAPTSAGLLNVDAHGEGLAILTPESPIKDFSALGISIEPASGSPQPTGDIVLLGAFN